MSIHISKQTEARLTEEAQRQGMSVDALIERLVNERAATAPAEERAGKSRDKRTGADLIAALQASPYRELEIEPPRVRLTTVRDVVL
jgi:hypothetical protein